ncbi:SDR family NAD(P)-dependent oxidoreductase [Chromobacterium sphagni]|uniref:SDR family NAD(P)-dependent oxidoreductase n=1 Tax=Chromobacterium sphagni TaxID=1903179 RepID=UPI0019D35B52|nr:SDR family NAD(P)-dependent oxidoreductase [Chromobacterium sphagni]
MARLSYKRVRQTSDISRLVLPEAEAPQAVRDAAAGDEEAVLAANVRRFVEERLSALGIGELAPLETDTLFFDAGLDSTHLLALVRELEARCGHDFYPTLLFEYQTLGALSHYLFLHEREHFAGTAGLAARDAVGMAPAPAVAPESRGAVQPPQSADIAVIGLAGRYPSASTLDRFWEVVSSGASCTREMPADHWGRFAVEGTASAASGAPAGYGGIVDDVDAFDALFFQITPAEAGGLDPQLRMLLEIAWHAMEDAGYPAEALRGSRTGVFAGVMNADYTWVAAEHLDRTGAYASAGSYAHELANRISYQFDLRGPSMTVEAACASSMLALHLARNALLTGECAMALAGGVNLSLHRSKYLLLGGLGLMSADGRERTFDAGANGYVPGEGAGMALLKPLSAALADGDRVYGVIAGSATNHSGRGSGRYSPNPNALVDVIERAVENAGVSADAILYVETHGTGTQIGDPIEIQALSRALSGSGARERRCALGSKANLGHLESASGICSLTKALLSIRRGQIPPCANVEVVNPGLRIEATPFVIPMEAVDWARPLEQRVAGIHSFGIGGSNVFMVVRGQRRRALAADQAARPRLLVLSAKTDSALDAYCLALLAYLQAGRDEDYTLGNLAFTLQTGRSEMAHRIALVVDDEQELLSGLRAYCEDGRLAPGMFKGRAPVAGRAPDAFGKPGADRPALLAVAQAWVNGTRIDWRSLDGGERGLRIAAPLYPFARDRHRISAPSEPAESLAPQAALFYATATWERKALARNAAAAGSGGASAYVLAAGVSEAVAAGIAAELPALALRRLPPPAADSAAEAAAELFRQALSRVREWLAAGVGDGQRMVALIDGHPSDPPYAPLSGLLKSAGLEYPRLRIQLIWVEGGLDAARGSRLLAEELGRGDDVEVYYRQDGRREVRSNRVAGFEPMAGSVIRQGGNYWITGGLGGLGRIFAAYIAGFGKVNVVLSGRRACTDAEREQLERLAAAGSRVEYLQCDVAVEEDVVRLVREVEARHGPLTGIIHGAGVVRDAMLLQKTERQADEVFAAKLFGTQIIDRATRHHRLDFFALFSSLSAVWGNVGQADYAAANAFLDAYAAWRDAGVGRGEAHGKTVSINWPLWRDGGMTIDAAGERRLREKTGMLPLSTQDGLRAFEDAIGRAPRQLIVCASDGSKPLFSMAAQAEAVSAAAPATAEAIRYLQRQLSKVFRLPQQRLEPEAPLEAFGIDSANVLALTGELEKDFGPLPKTLFYEYRTLAGLAGYLVDAHGAALHRLLPGAAAASAASAASPAPRPAVRAEPASVGVRQPGGPLDIAIIGMSGRFPQARNIAEFWENLRQGIDCVGEIPAARWDMARYYDADTGKSGKIHSKWGGFIDGVDEFDPLFFKISPLEAEMMDPQERLFLQTAWETLEDAGHTRASLQADGDGDGGLLPEARVGVYVGVMYSEYQLYGFQQYEQGQIFGLAGNIAGVANRVSYFFDFHGPSIALDTMCSSSLTALYLACNALRNGECGLALAGGVNTSIHPNKYAVLSQARIISTSGRCESFGKGGEGYIPGEGVGAVLLKPLERAVADGDFIYGVVKGAALSHGGKASGYTVPSPVAQAGTIALAIRQAGVEPRAISYIEAHGTGTSLGDPIEIAGLSKAFGQQSPDRQYCAIGSAKSNIGHCESAAGIAGICKVLLQMKHRMLVPSLHSSELNPYIDFAGTPFIVQRELAEWPAPVIAGRPQPRVAGVSSFGAGGANAHILIQEYIGEPSPGEMPGAGERRLILPLSARNDSRLHAYVADMLDYLEKSPPTTLADLAHTLQTGREAMDCRVAFLASNPAELREQMRDFLSEQPAGLDYFHDRTSQDTLDVFSDEDVRRAVVAGWIQSARYDKLAQFWTKGLAIDWALLPGPSGRRMAGLPTYPFERKKCWVSVRPSVPAANAAAGEFGGLLTRVLPAASLTDKPRVVFETELSATDPMLSHHRVQARSILPGVAYIEMALEAARHLYPGHDIALQDIVWMQPLFVADGERTVVTQLERHDGAIRFEIATTGESGRQVHAQGMVALDEAPRQAPAVDIEATLNRLELRWEGEAGRAEFYAWHRGKGIDYGPYFQGLAGLWGTAEESMGLVVLPAGCEADLVRYQLPPSIADAALQCVSGIAAGAGDGLALPYSIGRIEVLRQPQGRVFVHARKRADARFDLAVMDDSGALLVALDDFVLRPARTAGDPFSYAGRWQRSDLAGAEAAAGGGTGVSLLLYRDNDAGLEDAVARFGARSARIRLASGAGRREDGVWTVDVGDAAAIGQAIAEIGRIDAVYFLGGLTGSRAYGLDCAQVADDQEYTTIAWLRCIKALLAQGYDQRALDVFVLTQDCEQPPLQREINVWGSGLSGLTQSLAKEYPQWRIRNVDIGGADMDGDAGARKIAEMLGREPASATGFPVAYRGGVRYEHRIAPLAMPAGSPPAFVAGGVYVIAGGAGGIGRVATEHLLRHYDARVVWLGRSAVNDAIREQLDRFAGSGGSVEYLQVDITSQAQLERARDTVKARYGRINGVLHSAIVLRDQSLGAMDEGRFRESLDPKVAGSAALGQAFINEDLDWLGFYSSMQSFLAAAGQSNYAAGCTFKDAYARALGRACAFPVFSINWGYWGSVGVVANEVYRNRMASFGIGSLEPADGMGMQEAVVAHAIPQVLAIKLAPATRERMGIQAHGDEVYPRTQDSYFERIAAALDGGGTRSCALAEQIQQVDAADICLNDYVLRQLLQVMRAAGLDDVQSPAPALQRRLGVVERQLPLFEEIVRILADAASRRSGPLPSRDEVLSRYPGLMAHIALADACLQSLPQVLRGEKLATEVLFPGSSMALVEGIYKKNAHADYLNSLVEDAVESLVQARLEAGEANARIRILEVGAGTGGTSEGVFKRLARYQDHVEYVYTDLSKSFLLHARDSFSGIAPYMELQLFDAERAPDEQGVDSGSFDIVIAANVLHATRNIGNTLGNVKRCLKRNGLLILNEIAGKRPFTTLTFGLLDGWWAPEDREVRIEGSPALSREQWARSLAEQGFERHWLSDSVSSVVLQHVIVAESDGRVRQYQPRQAAARPAASPARKRPQEAPARPARAAGDLRSHVEHTLAEVVAEALKLSDAELDPGLALSDLGVDSIVAVDLVRRINAALSLSLKTTVIFDFPSITRLSAHLCSAYPDALARQASGQEAGGVDGGERIQRIAEELVRGAISFEQTLERLKS